MDSHSTQTTVSSATIIISILSSSLLAATLTKAAEYYFSKLNYKRDYLKIILEKRILAHEKILTLLFESGKMIIDHDKKSYTEAFGSYEGIYSYLNELIELQNYRMWISSNVDNRLDDLTSLLNDSIIKYDLNKNSSNDKCVKFAKEIFLSQVKKGRELHFAILKDLKTLHDVDKFFDAELKNVKTTPLPE